MAGGQVIGATAIELAIGRAFAEIQAVVVDDEAIAEGDDLAAERQVQTIVTQGRDQLARAPAGEGFVELGGAFAAIADAGGIAVAPGGRADQVGGAVDRAQLAQALVGAEAIFDEALAPGRAAAGAVVVLAAVEQAIHGEEVGIQVSIVIGIQLKGLNRGQDKQQAQAGCLERREEAGGHGTGS
ncbi:hypothetical protein D3C79_698650 [compost metagenome]